MKLLKEQMVPGPVAAASVESVERHHDARFPEAFRDAMMARNGGLVRTGGSFWWLFPFPVRPYPFGFPIMWLGRALRDIVSFDTEARGFPSFPKDLVAFGLRLYAQVPDGVLCFRRSAKDPRRLAPTVWVWYWQEKPMRRLLDDPAALWRDDPFRVPPPKQDWKLRRATTERAGLDALKRAGRRKGTIDTPVDLGWVSVGSVEWQGRRMTVTDGMQVPDEKTRAVTVAPGRYAVEVQVLAWGVECRIGGLRLRRAKGAVTRRRRMFTVDVDTASVVIGDVDRVLSCEESVLVRLGERLVDLPPVRDVELFAFGPTAFVRASSGWGDGTYPVYGLSGRDGRLGLEVTFTSAAAAPPRIGLAHARKPA